MSSTKGMQVRGGAVQFQRRGNLQFGEQSRWDRAPKRKGLWAFPTPYWEEFFTQHKLSDGLPKDLQRDEELYLPRNHKWFGEYTGEKVWVKDAEDTYRGGYWREMMTPLDPNSPAPEDLFIPLTQEEKDRFGLTRDLDLNSDKYGVLEEFYQAQEKWKNTIGKKLAPIRKFWYTGELYCHFSFEGEILGLDQWTKMDAVHFASLVKKTGGNRFRERDKDGRIVQWKSSSDHLEVFMAPGDGKISGRFERP